MNNLYPYRITRSTVRTIVKQFNESSTEKSLSKSWCGNSTTEHKSLGICDILKERQHLRHTQTGNFKKPKARLPNVVLT